MNLTTALSLVTMLLAGLASALVTPITEFWTAHGTLAVVVSSLWGALNAFLPSVLKPAAK